MYIFRFVVLAIFVVMLLPTGEQPAERIGENGSEAGFCHRYPKTCDASDELYTAFKKKLGYGFVQVRDMLRTHSDVQRLDSAGDTSRRYAEEPRPPRMDYERGALRADERAPEWQRY